MITTRWTLYLFEIATCVQIPVIFGGFILFLGVVDPATGRCVIRTYAIVFVADQLVCHVRSDSASRQRRLTSKTYRTDWVDAFELIIVRIVWSGLNFKNTVNSSEIAGVSLKAC